MAQQQEWRRVRARRAAAAVLAGFALLTACGGGADGDDGPTVPPTASGTPGADRGEGALRAERADGRRGAAAGQLQYRRRTLRPGHLRHRPRPARVDQRGQRLRRFVPGRPEVGRRRRSRRWSRRCAAGSGGRWRPPRRTTRGRAAVGGARAGTPVTTGADRAGSGGRPSGADRGRILIRRARGRSGRNPGSRGHRLSGTCVRR